MKTCKVVEKELKVFLTPTLGGGEWQESDLCSPVHVKYENNYEIIL
jgi:hypothetical protein